MHVIKVVGMSCAHCVSAVEAAVLKVDSRARVEVDAPFRAAIEQAGYTVAD